MGYTIGSKEVAKTLIRAGRERPWDDRHGSTKIHEPVGIFMRTQVVELEEDAPEPDADGVLTATECTKKRAETDEETEQTTLETTDETTDAMNIELPPIAKETRVLTTTDVYNSRFFLAIPPSEVFGTLKSQWQTGQSATITLDEGFSISGETEVEMDPAPVVIAEVLDAETPVTCRYIKTLGEWRFFPPAGGDDRETAILTASGNALNGFGTHQNRTVWATQLSAASDNVQVYLTVAVAHDQPAIASDDETPWLVFPTSMTGATAPSYVRGDKYMANGLIYNKSDFGTVYTKSGTDYHPTFQMFNGQDCWRATENGPFLYYDGFGRWMDGDLGIIHADPPEQDPQATGGIYGAPTISELGFILKSKPYWSSTSTYGVYKPQNGASGELVFGLPTWVVTDDEGEQTFSRSWKKTDGYWTYNGSVTIDEMEYTNIIYKTDVTSWVLGTYNSESRGWYASENEPSTTQNTTFTFEVVAHDDKTATPAQLLRGWEATNGEIVYNTDHAAYEIAHTPVAWWSLAAGSVSGVSFTFAFQAPEESEVTGQPLTITLAEILDHTWSHENGFIRQVRTVFS